ncbi:MAG: TRAP transporter substrate-binding protein DctP [Pseudomonadota bacterium]
MTFVQTKSQLLSMIRMVAVSIACAWALPALAVDIKIATVAPEGSSWMNQMRAGAKDIAARTDGRVKLKFYGGGVMGNDKKVLRKMRIGQLHGGAFTASSLAERYPDIQLYGLPLLLRTQAEVNHVRAEMDDEIMGGMADAGLVCLGIASGGFANIMSAEPVRSSDDLSGQKVWVPEGDAISYAAMASLGLSPVTLPITDVLTGLQTGLVDIIGSSPVGALVLQWHTKVKFITPVPVSYLYGTLVIEKKVFDRLSASDQAIVREVMAGVYANFEKENVTDDEKALAAMLKGGIELIEPAPGLVDGWSRQAREVRARLASEGVYSADRLARIDSLLADYRAANP